MVDFAEEHDAHLPLPEPAPEPKKRVRATIADTVAIATALADLVEWSPEQDDIPAEERAHWYARGWSDERIARDRVPHLAAHHVTTVREALYPNWRKLSAEMTVEERLDEMEARYSAIYERVNALDREASPNVEERLSAIEAADPVEIGRRLAVLEGAVNNMLIREVDEPNIERRLVALERRALGLDPLEPA